MNNDNVINLNALSENETYERLLNKMGDTNLPDTPMTPLEALACLDWASPTIPEAKHFGIKSLKGRISFTKDHTFVIDGNTLYIHNENFIGESSREFVLSE
jgi:cell division protein FtsX